MFLKTGMNDDTYIPLNSGENSNHKESYQTHEMDVTYQPTPSYNVRAMPRFRSFLLFEDGPGFGGFKAWSETKSELFWIYSYVFIFVVVAVVGYSYVFESWPIIDSIYAAVIIFTTVGYGDLCPSNDASRLFTMSIGLFGIIILGILLGVMSEKIVNRQEKRMEVIKNGARTRVIEKFLGESNAEGAAKKKNHVCLAVLKLAPLGLLLCIFAYPIAHVEKWDLVTSAYFTFITGTTVGLGDEHPTTTFTKFWAVLYIPLSVTVFAIFLDSVADAYVENKKYDTEHEFLSRSMTLSDLKNMDIDGDGEVSKIEFLRYMLVALQKVKQEDIDDIMEVFEKLDSSKTGKINTQDLLAQCNEGCATSVVS